MSSSEPLSLRSILPIIPGELADAFQTEYTCLESHFVRGDWGPAELNGGRFAEVVLRYLEWRASDKRYTPIGRQLRRQDILNRVYNDCDLPDGLRFGVAKCGEVLLDVRNKRDVAHLGTTINVEKMDAHLVMGLCSWILAEIIREESRVPVQSVQEIIDRLCSRRLSLIEEVGGDLVVVATDLPARDRALVVLYRVHPEPMNIAAIQKAVGYTNTTRFSQIIREHAKNGLTYLKGADVYLTMKGIAWVEKNIEMALSV